MTKTFTITGANKMVRSAFNTIGDAYAHITKNKLFPAMGYPHITITETTVSQHFIQTKKPQLSIESKTMLVESAKAALKNNTNVCWDLTAQRFMYRYYMHNIQGDSATIAVTEIAKRLSGKSDEEFYDAYKKRDDSYSFRNPTELQKWVSENDKEIVDELIKIVLEDPNSLEYMITQTNYKPCKAVCLVYGSDLNANIVIQIRNEDIVISSGFIHGRKVSLTNVCNVDEDSLKKFESTIILW